MAEKGAIVLTKPVVAGIIAGLGIAFGAGVKSSARLFDAEAKPLQVAAASIAPFQVDAAVTAEQVRQLSADLHDFRIELRETRTQVGDLNARLSKIEGAAAEKAAATNRSP